MTAYMTFEPAEGTKVKYAAKKTALEMGRDYVGIAVVLVPDSNQLLCMCIVFMLEVMNMC